MVICDWWSFMLLLQNGYYCLMAEIDSWYFLIKAYTFYLDIILLHI